MRQLTFVEPMKIEFREVAPPSIQGSGEALVRPIAVARCDLDLVFARGKVPIAGPFALGHECVGEVIEIGAGVRSVKPGDRVIVPFQISCGACARCLRGLTGSCTAVPKLASYGLAPLAGAEFGGAVSDALRVPFADAMLVPLPDGLDPAVAAALGDNAVDGFRTVDAALAKEPGAAVLVAGGGAPSVGLYAVLSARALGSEVVYVDPSEERCAIAARLGATVHPEKSHRDLRLGRFRVTVDATSRADGLHFCLASTDVEGTCTSVGVYFADVPMPLLEMYTRGITFVTGRIQARRDLPRALAVLAGHGLETVATRIVAWEDAPAAWLEPTPKLVISRA